MENNTILHRGIRYLVNGWAPNGMVAIEPPNAALSSLLRDVIIQNTPLLYRPSEKIYEVVLPNYSLVPTTAKLEE